MTRPIVFAIVLAASAFGTGCTTSSNPRAEDAAAPGDTTPVDTDAATSCTDANIQLIVASNYDQSCTTAADCIAVGEGNACYPCVIACPTAAINAGAKAKYLSDVAKTPAADQAGAFCGCPAAFNPCCRGGTCHADLQCQSPEPVPDASTDAADACAPTIVCTGACISGAHNVSHMVDGCLVVQCCVPDDAGAE